MLYRHAEGGDNDMQTCFFIGHREAPEDIYPALHDVVLRYIEVYGVTDYVVGHYGRFDALAVRAVRAAKRIHPDVRLSLLLPYHPAEREVAQRGSGGRQEDSCLGDVPLFGKCSVSVSGYRIRFHGPYPSGKRE